MSDSHRRSAPSSCALVLAKMLRIPLGMRPLFASTRASRGWHISSGRTAHLRLQSVPDRSLRTLVVTPGNVPSYEGRLISNTLRREVLDYMLLWSAPFDTEFIVEAAARNRLGLPDEWRRVDTLPWARTRLRGPRDYKLPTLLTHNRFRTHEHHRALADAAGEHQGRARVSIMPILT